MTYADIILPLPLDSLFTYSVPDSLAGRVGQGIRVLVPFGKSKTYVGLVVRTHNNKPDFNVKDISTVMDDALWSMPCSSSCGDGWPTTICRLLAT